MEKRKASVCEDELDQAGKWKLVRVSDDAAPLQAVIFADFFEKGFRPVSFERPKALIPLVNIPIIDYSLAWLESIGVQEVFVFCFRQFNQVKDYLENSQWSSLDRFQVKMVEFEGSILVTDMLRLFYQKQPIRGEFVLISGDIMSNMNLTEVFKEHNERKKKDVKSIMTIVIRKLEDQTSLNTMNYGYAVRYMDIHPQTKELLYYDNKRGYEDLMLSRMPLNADNPVLFSLNNKQDCSIYICSPEVLNLLADEFRYQHMRRFIKGLLADKVNGYKIFTHEVQSNCQVAKVENFQCYFEMSKDIKNSRLNMCRLVPHSIQERYKESKDACPTEAQRLLKNGTTISESSVIGEGCKIGSHVVIKDSYIWNNVTIEDHCTIEGSIICDGAVIHEKAVVRNCLISFKVVLEPEYHGFAMVSSRVKQPSYWSDEDRLFS
ncbi:Bacterial transferase hexapeptide repeat [Macleaya cordata]|uniref:Bacterial transferase hexapeptide repeat n=1 Tax=Macleaya cordata TaxID=56857 RepID=A0A200QJP6_MACCD|nr:Bacterial transferase hexapeptide repeat [Macleaya cordata]